jgi:hypothetical protein
MLQRLIFILGLCLILLACSTDKPAETAYSPILMYRPELLQSISAEAPHPITSWGKIYTHSNRVYVVEPYEGLHIYDVSEITDPVALVFIRIPGILDVAVREGIIYADNAVDLVCLSYDNDILKVLYREPHVFPEIVAPDLGRIPERYLPQNRPANTVIVNWEKR